MSSKLLSCIAHQHPIGQGGFYSATIRIRGRDCYTFVYDCGSLTDWSKHSGCPRLSAEIEQFGRELGRRYPLDLLVLSHFDADHVNGVSELLGSTDGVKDVFLPYLSPLERLIYALRYPTQSETFRRFLVDPVVFLRQLGARNIYLVRRGDQERPDDRGNMNDPEPGLAGRIRETETLELDRDALDRMPSVVADYESELGGMRAPEDVYGVTDSKSVTLSGIWKIRFFQKEDLRMALDRVRASGDLTTPRKDDEEICRKFLEALQRALKGAELTNPNIVALIGSIGDLKAIRATYKGISSKHNDVSLCLWHGPARSQPEIAHLLCHGTDAVSAIAGLLYNRGEYWRTRRHYESFGGGTMLTGDVGLKGDTLTAFKKHFIVELPATSLIQIPHHGARANLELDDDLFEPDRLGFLSAGLRSS
jgi:hypothetical protein